MERIMKNDVRIAILLSTYNGERYIAEQIESLVNQTYKNIIIHVRDDCSTDNTYSIVKDYSLRFSNIVLHEDNKIRLGGSQSFLWLLSKVNEKYYMFCDQDDVWFDSKVKLSFESIRCVESYESNCAIVVHTDLVVVDESLGVINKSFWAYQGLQICAMKNKYLPFKNYVTGCTMIINSAAKMESLKFAHKNIIHDYLIALAVDSVGGRIVSLPISTIFYRQHSNNVVGAIKRLSICEKVIRLCLLPDLMKIRNQYVVLKEIYSMSLIAFIFLKFMHILKFGR